MRGKFAHRVDAREDGAGRRAYGAMRARVDARGWGFGIAAPIARERSGRRRALAHGRIAHRASAMDVDDMHACVRAVCDGFACARGAAASIAGVGSYRGCGVDKVARAGRLCRAYGVADASMWVLKRWGDVRWRVLSTVLAREASEGGDGCLYARARSRLERI